MEDYYYDSLEDDDAKQIGREKGKAVGKSSKTLKHNPRQRRSNSYCRRSSISSESLSQVLLDSGKRRKSYVQLFHEKIGYTSGTELTDTTRSICDQSSFYTACNSSSATLDFSDALSGSFVSDSSFYKEYLKNECTGETMKICLKNTAAPSCTPKVVSNRNLSMWAKSTQSIASSISTTPKTKKPVEKHSKSILKVPPLGSLGPDPEASKEKMERLKRQQQYGQKVSNQNMIRMMEAKVLKDFKHEMRKSSHLNMTSSKC